MENVLEQNLYTAYSEALPHPIINVAFTPNSCRSIPSPMTDYDEIVIDEVFQDLFEDGYDYDLFVSHFKMVQWSSMRSLKATPHLSWFLVDEAINSRQDFFQYHEAETIEWITTIAKKVNRWNFMKDIVRTGDFWMATSLPLAMKLLAVFHEDHQLTKPGLRVLDGGCGTGFLIACLALATHANAEVWGMEIDTDVIRYCRHSLFESPDTWTHRFDSTEVNQLRQKLRVVKAKHSRR